MMPTNPKQMKKMMKQMGINMEEIDAEEVIIRKHDEELIFRNPQISKIVAKGQETFQITGEYETVEREVDVSDDDVQLVAEQTGASEDDARKALKEAKGDIAEATMKLQG